MIDPLALYLIDKYRQCSTIEQQGPFWISLSELGYWLQYRPENTTEQFIKKTCDSKIAKECDNVLEFKHTEPNIEGCLVNEEDRKFIISVYRER